jgi:hypothetical protein
MAMIWKKLHDLPVEYFVTGETRYEHAAINTLAPDIHLKINPRLFEWRCYLSLLYVFLHELVAHTSHDTTVRPTPCEPDDSFEEGWMDWIAFELFREELGTGKLTGLAPALLRERLHHGRIVHDARYDLDVPTPSKNAVALDTGRNAALKMLRLLTKLGEKAPFERMLQLSLALNRDTGKKTRVERIHLVRLIDASVPEDGGLSHSPVYGMLVRAVMDYVKTKDARAFLQRSTEIRGQATKELDHN